jgi:hypothetical protein
MQRRVDFLGIGLARPSFKERSGDPMSGSVSKFCRINLRKGTVLTVVVANVASCSFASYPTKMNVEDARNNTPRLETIADGRSYLAVVRNGMVTDRNNLQIIDYGLDAGIVGGLVTTALGTALQWGTHANIRAVVLSGAVIGVSSVLSLKQQVLIINKGLDALVCVESQAEAAYVPVRPVDTALAPVAGDIQNLQAAIQSVGQVQSGTPLSNAVILANADLVNAKSWLSVKSVPIVNVVASVKVGVDTVLQTTIDQLNMALPDGSAFAKISLGPQPASTPPSGTPPTQKLTSLALSVSVAGAARASAIDGSWSL